MQPTHNKILVSFLLTLTLYLLFEFLGVTSWYLWRFIGMLGLFMIIMTIEFYGEETIYKSDVMHFIDEEMTRRMDEMKMRSNIRFDMAHIPRAGNQGAMREVSPRDDFN